MKSKYFGLLILLLLVALNVGLCGYYFPVLPDRVASEFDLQGKEIKAMPKGTFMAFNGTLVVAMPAFLLLLGWGCTKLPNWMIDMPNRDYWLAPQRKPETAKRLFLFILWLAVGVEAFLTSILFFVFRANMGHPESMVLVPYYCLSTFLAFVAVWCAWFMIKFKKLPPA
jgi:hypothetical protein